VRQDWPWVDFASAPGGWDSTRKTFVSGDDLKKSVLGSDDEHAASVKLHANKAMIGLMETPTNQTTYGRLSP
jgi:hypothetical protein